MKNPALCQRRGCRARWRWWVSGFNAHRNEPWTLRLCEHHAEPYTDREDEARSVTDSIGRTVTRTRRGDPA